MAKESVEKPCLVLKNDYTTFLDELSSYECLNQNVFNMGYYGLLMFSILNVNLNIIAQINFFGFNRCRTFCFELAMCWGGDIRVVLPFTCNSKMSI